MGRIRLTVEYDGSNYAGFQAQPGESTIQTVLEETLDRLIKRLGRLQAAGRTDAGVHALGQVVAVNYDGLVSPERLRSGLNALLPIDISVRNVALCSNSFDPRRDASSRVYEYRILNRNARSALYSNRAHHISRRLDICAMGLAADQLVGTHDFSGFVVDTDEAIVRRVEGCLCWRQDDIVYIRISANAYAKRMVRRISGALIQVGLGRFSLKDFIGVLTRSRNAPIAPTAPATGLYLVDVEYEERVDPFNNSGNLSRTFREIDVH